MHTKFTWPAKDMGGGRSEIDTKKKQQRTENVTEDFLHLSFSPIRGVGMGGGEDKIKRNKEEVFAPCHTCSLICTDRNPVVETLLSIAKYMQTKTQESRQLSYSLKQHVFS